MSTQKQDQTKQIVLEIMLKALREESYKERLLVNPTEAIKEIYPDFYTDAEIVVQDQTAPNTLFINVSPVEIALLYEGAGDLELSEEALEMVSGGAMTVPNWICGNKVNGYDCKSSSTI